MIIDIIGQGKKEGIKMAVIRQFVFFADICRAEDLINEEFYHQQDLSY